MNPLLFILILLLSGCLGSELNEGEDYGNLLDSPEGLVVTEVEHTGGWGRADCTTCHNLENVHLVDRTGGTVDITAVYNQAISQGNTGCPACHGTNGVP
ncbi:MAG: hypothetical protein HYT77_02925 [Deltaproteobacteria bacterium]|nr:hypothetical protein [Deltaproteobacteria bacterium]